MKVCDGHVDCTGGADEIQCPGRYYCADTGNRTWVKNSEVCNKTFHISGLKILLFWPGEDASADPCNHSLPSDSRCVTTGRNAQEEMMSVRTATATALGITLLNLTS